ncbi:pyridoxamine 5'-phosphate oxidase family protein [Micromonospora sp. 067-2]|uniref:pyridoxamine 5'-phosphate oxidase family protein n=1 Tax=Micromonospora sp. 067-2 TaxID=2789270 RepID=UPI003979790B
MNDAMQRQRRGNRIAMTAEDIDTFLAEQRVCRLATIGLDGPHVTPLWFCWHHSDLWLYSIARSQRFSDVRRDPRVSAVVDDGHDYLDLRGVEITGIVETVGEVPRVGEPNEQLPDVEATFAEKYFGMRDLPYDGKHAWLRLRPTKITSWDFRKLAGG